MHITLKKHNLKVEYEATFSNINVDEMRTKIEQLGGKLLKPKFKQKRTTFNFPKGHEIKGGFIRVRDESGKITMTLKIIESSGAIESQKEVELIVDDYHNAIRLLKIIGADQKAVQETKREVWEIDGVEIMIDWWPFLEPILEIEGRNEHEVKSIAEKLGFNWEEAIFDAVGYIYSQKYNISIDRINNNTPEILFDMDNPFVD